MSDFDQRNQKVDKQFNIGEMKGDINIAGDTPSIWVGVPLMPAHFVGRDQIAQELATQLTGGSSLALSAQGLPGVGKTTLAVALAHHPEVRAKFKDGVLWAGLGPQAQESDLASILNRWADALGVDVSDKIEVSARKEALADAIGQRALLIVIDDAWDYELAKMLRFGNPHCRHLLTTRDQAIARQFAGAGGSIAVPTLEEDPAWHLLQELAPEACAANPEAARTLAQEVGGLPLALELLGGYLAIPQHSLLPQLSQAALQKMTDPRRRLQLAQERLGGSGPQTTLQETITLSLDGLAELEDGPEAQRAFYALGAFAPKPEQFSMEAAEAVSGVGIETLVLLVARNLLELTDGQLAMHQVVADVALSGLDEAAVTGHRDFYLNLVNADRQDWQRIEGVYGQIKWAWQSVPEDEGLLEMIGTIRIYQQRRGLWPDNLAWARRGLELAKNREWRKVEGMMLRNIGLAIDNLGQRDKALAYYNLALPISEEVGDRGGQAHTLNNIGLVYANLGQGDKALGYFRQALSIQEEDGYRRGQAVTLNNIGAVFDSLGQPDKALEYYIKALPTLEEVGDWTVHATTLNNIGQVYDNQGQDDKALAYYNQALPISDKVGDRAGLAVTLFNVALIYRNQGRLQEAVTALKQVLELDRLVQHPDLESDSAALAQVEGELAAQQKKGAS